MSTFHCPRFNTEPNYLVGPVNHSIVNEMKLLDYFCQVFKNLTCFKTILLYLEIGENMIKV